MNTAVNLGLQAVGMDGSPLFQSRRSADRSPRLNATTFTASESAIASTGITNASTISPAASMTTNASLASSDSLLATVSARRRCQCAKLTGYNVPKSIGSRGSLRSRWSTKDSHRLHPRDWANLHAQARAGGGLKPPSPAPAIWNHQRCHPALAFLLHDRLS
jgi:hypothetical protein